VTGSKNVLKLIYWGISNIAGGNLAQVKQLIDAPIFTIIKKDLVNPDYGIRLELYVLIRNMMSLEDPEITLNLIKQEIADIIISALKNEIDRDMIKQLMFILNHFLRVGRNLSESIQNSFILEYFERNDITNILNVSIAIKHSEEIDAMVDYMNKEYFKDDN
jgi:hypothetical protein